MRYNETSITAATSAILFACAMLFMSPAKATFMFGKDGPCSEHGKQSKFFLSHCDDRSYDEGSHWSWSGGSDDRNMGRWVGRDDDTPSVKVRSIFEKKTSHRSEFDREHDGSTSEHAVRSRFWDKHDDHGRKGIFEWKKRDDWSFDDDDYCGGAMLGWMSCVEDDDKRSHAHSKLSEKKEHLNDKAERLFEKKIGKVREWHHEHYCDHVQPVPVPAAVWLFSSGLISLLGLLRRRG